MARFLSLALPAAIAAGTCAFISHARAESAMQLQGQPLFPGVATTNTVATPAALVAPNAKAPATNTAAAPAVAPVNPNQLQNSLVRYGKIVAPGDQAYPLKLKLPYPGAGEVKVPTPDELAMREKLEQLAKMSDEEIHTQLEHWPVYAKMSLRDQGQMLSRIQDFRDYRSRTALQKAHDMGLLTLTPDQKSKFEKEYWDARLKMDHELVKQFGPVFKAHEEKMEDALFREFSTSMGPIAQGPKAPQPGPISAPPAPPVNPVAPQVPAKK